MILSKVLLSCAFGFCLNANMHAADQMLSSAIIPAVAHPDAEHKPVQDPNQQQQKPIIQIAILLDNSGSMSGLIDQAKSQIWSLVNEFITAKQLGEQPQLQVALFTYGNPPPKMLLPLTNDLDKVSQALFAVTINGGSEYCGEVIQSAITQLSWSDNPNDLRVIFIAGNEPFSQGSVPYQNACQVAINKGVIVNTIHCGDGIPEDWRHAAQLADGKAMEINHNQAVVYIESPQDKKISELSTQLNKTYVSYGSDGERGFNNQDIQDSNAASSSAGSFVQRAVSKANHVYCNDSWDLVDACKDNYDVLTKLKKEDLPVAMQSMNIEQQKEYLDQQRQQRLAIQQEINALNKERQTYVEEKRKAEGLEDDSLNSAMQSAIKEQAALKQITFK